MDLAPPVILVLHGVVMEYYSQKIPTVPRRPRSTIEVERNHSTPMFTLTEITTWEEEIKKSRFLAHAGPVSTPEDTFAFLERVKDPQAAHNCWAFRIDTNFRFSDDGEPKGTAGRPILVAIERQKLDDEYEQLVKQIEGLKAILGSDVKVRDVIRGEIETIREKFADERRTEIVAAAAGTFDAEDLIPEEDMVVTISHLGYILRYRDISASGPIKEVRQFLDRIDPAQLPILIGSKTLFANTAF